MQTSGKRAAQTGDEKRAGGARRGVSGASRAGEKEGRWAEGALRRGGRLTAAGAMISLQVRAVATFNRPVRADVLGMVLLPDVGT